MAEMESQMNHIAQTVMIHKEKVARREIGVLTANKVSTRQYKIVAPLNPEKPIKYVRKPIDYSLLDDVGHGLMLSNQKKMQHRGSSQGSLQAMGSLGANISVGPPPTTKPPTPPQMARNPGNMGTLKPGSTGTLKRTEYRTPPVVVPPQVPSHYAPNYPMGHPKRQNSGGSTGPPTTIANMSSGERGPGYSALPMPPSQVIMQHIAPPPQIGMVYPMPPVTTHGSTFDERHAMPPPPSPLTVTHEMPDHSHIGMHTLRGNINMPRPGSQSPPLPPPPPPEGGGDPNEFEFGRPRNSQSVMAPIVPEDQNLPGWVPKNYIEKGECVI